MRVAEFGWLDEPIKVLVFVLDQLLVNQRLDIGPTLGYRLKHSFWKLLQWILKVRNEGIRENIATRIRGKQRFNPNFAPALCNHWLSRLNWRCLCEIWLLCRPLFLELVGVVIEKLKVRHANKQGNYYGINKNITMPEFNRRKPVIHPIFRNISRLWRYLRSLLPRNIRNSC